jgi:hypothetical protein
MRCRQSFLEDHFPQEGRLVLTGLWSHCSLASMLDKRVKTEESLEHVVSCDDRCGC